jgi:hypothetical protein
MVYLAHGRKMITAILEIMEPGADMGPVIEAVNARIVRVEASIESGP